MADGTGAGAGTGNGSHAMDREAEEDEGESADHRFQLGQLSGALVEVFGMEMSLRPLQSWDQADVEEQDEGEDAIDPNGQAGQALYFDVAQYSYLVITFDGLLLKVPEAHLQEYEPVRPEDGGFDLLWPLEENEQAHSLGAQMVKHILLKGYVVVQLWNTPSQREAVVRCTRDISRGAAVGAGAGGWHLPRRHFEATYLGRKNCTKYAIVKTQMAEEEKDEGEDEAGDGDRSEDEEDEDVDDDEDDDEDDGEGEGEGKSKSRGRGRGRGRGRSQGQDGGDSNAGRQRQTQQDPLESAQVYNRLLSQAALALEPHGETLGYELWGRMPGLLRVPLLEDGQRQSAGSEARAKLKEREVRRGLRRQGGHERGPDPDDDDDGDGGMRRGEGDGQLISEEDVWGQVTFLQRRTLMLICMIENSGGELELIPREDLDESPVILPLARNRLIVFNSQLLAHQYSPRGGQSSAIQTWLLKEPTLPDPSTEPCVELPAQLQQARPHIMSLMVNYPGQSWGPQHYWMTACAGADTLTTVPMARFDMNLYYREEPAEGWSYAYHGAFTADSGLLFFDNEKFKITSAEAKRMSPAQRTVLETGYEVLVRGGHSRASLQGAHCGVFLGDSGSLWELECEASLISSQCSSFRDTGRSNAISGSRLSHCLGLQGPVTTVDTACSSSLVAVTLAHDCVRKAAPLTTLDQSDGQGRGRGKGESSSRVPDALAIGVNLLLHPKWYVLYSGPKMLSPRGRCFTFDGSADGYARGEGCGGLYLACSEDERQDAEMLACLAGSAANQDGKSASMTAPHGPSQQQCILASLAEMELKPGEVAMAECHGTGTALGDPIEVGALRAVTSKRKMPVLCASAKTILGHLEASAGLAGLIKCVCTALFSSGSPNCHSNRLNPHLDVNGYPVCFTSEATDFDARASLVGVSSFGFGGTNARGDIWGRAQLGPRSTRQLVTPARLEREMSRVERLEEGHTLGPLEAEVIYAVGSWDAYQSPVALERVGEGGDFRFFITLGETLREHFWLRINGNPEQTFHPGSGLRDADQERGVVGPEPATNTTGWWLIDGRSADLPEGTTYQVVFSWRFSWELGEYKSIWWEPMPKPRDEEAETTHCPHRHPRQRQPSSTSPPTTSKFRHRYHILGTFNSWRCQEMQSGEEEGLWSCEVRIGMSEQEEFRFARDADWRQLLYPATPRARKTTIPIQGPDSLGSDKAWLLRGPRGEVVKIKLRVLEGEISMSTSSPTAGSKVWQNAGPGESTYCISGSWNAWAFTPMISTANSNIFRYRVQLGASGMEEFQLALESDRSRRLYPAMERAGLGDAELCGPDDNGHDGLTWVIDGDPGQWFDIVLDMSQVDRAWAVWWAEADADGDIDFDVEAGVQARTSCVNSVRASGGSEAEAAFEMEIEADGEL